MTDYFINILELGSYLSHQLKQFIESILLRHVREISRDYEDLVSHDDGNSSHSIDVPCHGDITLQYKSLAYINALESDIHPVNQKKTCSRNSESVWSSKWNYFIYQWLSFPLTGLRLGCKVISISLKSFCIYVGSIYIKGQRFMSRLRLTLKGSSDDIGWLQRSKDLPAVKDGTVRFMELLHDVRNNRHILPNSLVYLLIPGLFSNHSPLYFVNTKRFFSKMGLTCHIAKIHSEASVDRNSWELKQYIEELYWGSGKRILLLGHSKGGVDAAAALSLYWSELKDKVAGLALIQSPYGGSPIASDILREGQIADKEARRVIEFIICKLIKGDMRALEDLTYEKRKDFISKHRLPVEEIPVISFHSEARIAPGVFATMSHIAHAELPWFPLPRFLTKYSNEFDLRQGRKKVPIVMPISAAMAICALHLNLRYGERSDGLVTSCDAEVPGSVVVRIDKKLDHGWMVYSSRKTDLLEADAGEMCEALLTMLVEIGQQKLQNQSNEDYSSNK